MVKWGVWLLLLGALDLLASSPVAPKPPLLSVHSFTNHAGHAVTGWLSAIANGIALINGRAYPLAVFPKSEQVRMREILQAPADLPPELVRRRRVLRERYLRNEALLKAGAKTPEAAERQRADLETAWRHALESADLDGATRADGLRHFPD